MLVSHCYNIGIYCDGARCSAVTNCRVSSIGEGSTDAYGIVLEGQGGTVTGCTVTDVQASSTNTVGIDGATFAVGNFVSGAYYGLIYCTKYKDNLTSGCTTPFATGTDAGGNN